MISMSNLIKSSRILKECSKFSINELTSLIHELENIHSKIYWDTYTEVYVYPKSNIAKQITKETGFKCRYYYTDYPTEKNLHIISIPLEKYSKQLEKELIEKYGKIL
jgi:hypothetical protein